MVNLTSSYGSEGGKPYSYTNVPEGPAGAGGGTDPTAYLMSLLAREDEWKRQQWRDGAIRAGMAKEAQKRPSLGSQAQRNYVSPAGHDDPRMMSLVNAGGGAGMEPYYTEVQSGLGRVGGVGVASGPGPNSNFAGYRPKGSIPEGGAIAAGGRSDTQQAGPSPADLEWQRKMAEDRARFFQRGY